MWKKSIISFFCLLQVSCFAARADNVDEYTVMQSDYRFSTVFDMYSNEQLMGSVEKSIFHVREHYTLYDGDGKYVAQGIKSPFNLGLFYKWATEIDIYDENGNHIGKIDGQVVSSEEAKFSIYDYKGDKVGIAYLDKNCGAFTIFDPNNSSRMFARLSRNFVLDTIDHWDVAVFKNCTISPYIIQIFAAFACDTQEYFKSDK